MIVKIFIETINAQGERNCECRVLYAENGAAIGRRIGNTIAKLKADGYKYVSLRDCINLEISDIFQTPKKQEITNSPAWSLNALLGLLPKEIKVDESPHDEVQRYGLLIYPVMGGWQAEYQYCEDDECHCLKCVYGTDLLEACVQLIEWLSENGYKLNEI